MTVGSGAILAAELERRAGRDWLPVSVAEFDRRFAALGYRVDRDGDCRGTARYMTGAWAGASYPACSTGLREADTGLRAFNADARRDAAFRAMQELRGEIFAVTRDGFILEV